MCDFKCTSNNQMCRHIFLTGHSLVNCTQCEVKLVCWGFAPGVVKLFHKGFKDSVIVEPVIIETSEGHAESSGHVNMHAYLKDHFVLPGTAELYGIVPNTPPVSSDSTKFRCPDCAAIAPTWTQMTKHLDTTKHGLAQCADCDVGLKCYGPSQPQRHEKLSGHRALRGIFRQKCDYDIARTGGPTAVPQYKCFCGVTLLSQLHIADHLTDVHKFESSVSCTKCRTEGAPSEFLQHRAVCPEPVLLVDVHEFDVNQLLVRLPTVRLNDYDPAGKEFKILYQCPVCCYLFSTWSSTHRHLLKQQHALNYCRECQMILAPSSSSSSSSSGITSPGPTHHPFGAMFEHTRLTGHRDIVGQHFRQEDFEVLVDCRNAELVKLLDSDAAFSDSLRSQLIMYQCPIDDCLDMFMTAGDLEHHVNETGHGVVHCDECDLDVSMLYDGIASHEHTLNDVPPALAQSSLSLGEDFRVLASEDDILQYYSNKFVRCAVCSQVTTATSDKGHSIRAHSCCILVASA